MNYYNLDVIISVGYRVKSLRGTQFRIWASSVLKEYMKKGFALDDDRLKRLGRRKLFLTNCLPVSGTFGLQKRCFGEKYLRFMQPALIMIRARKPLFSSLSRYKIRCTGLHTGIQRLKIVYQRADAEKENMGLTSWEGKKIKRADTEIAKELFDTDRTGCSK